MLNGLMETMIRDKVEANDITTIRELLQEFKSIPQAAFESLSTPLAISKEETNESQYSEP